MQTLFEHVCAKTRGDGIIVGILSLLLLFTFSTKEFSVNLNLKVCNGGIVMFEAKSKNASD